MALGRTGFGRTPSLSKTIPMKQPIPNDDPAARPPLIDNGFTRLLSEHRCGHLAHELSTELRALLAACEETGKPGSLTLKLFVKPANKGQALLVLIEDELSLTAPKLPVEPSVFFVDPDHNLSRDHPQQLRMELRTVEVEPVATAVLRQAASQ